MNKKELLLLSYFRDNARHSLTNISKQTSMPVSTIFDKLKKYENTIIKRHTSLLNFKNMGYDLKTYLFLKLKDPFDENCIHFLVKHPLVNSVFRLHSGFDLVVEAVFRNLSVFHKFISEISYFNVQKREEFFIVEDILTEGFLNGIECCDKIEEYT